MKEVIGNLWGFHRDKTYVVVTTNGTVKNNGQAVMGRGVAIRCSRLYPDIPALLGHNLQQSGNHCYFYNWPFHIITFPVKHQWWEKADLELIRQSCKELIVIVDKLKLENVYMTRPGCGNGKLRWSDVRPILVEHFDDRFTIVELPA